MSSITLSSTQEGGGLSPIYKGFFKVLYGTQLYDVTGDPKLYTVKLGTFPVYDPFNTDDIGQVSIIANPTSPGVAVTPEPSTLLLLSSGLLGLSSRLRFRRSGTR